MTLSNNDTEWGRTALYAFASRFQRISFDEICKHLRIARVPAKFPAGVHASLGKLGDQWLVQYALSATDEPTMQFLVFHEIGHIILCPSDISLLDPVSADEEALCDRFAALMVMAQHADVPFTDKTIQQLLANVWTEESGLGQDAATAHMLKRSLKECGRHIFKNRIGHKRFQSLIQWLLSTP